MKSSGKDRSRNRNQEGGGQRSLRKSQAILDARIKGWDDSRGNSKHEMHKPGCMKKIH